jgi:peptidoglycan/LPS O-acetylase OafA/YrhL
VGLADPSGTLPHLPALDGLRGLAVGAVLLFHAGFSWMAGGYLGVSTFFTLSGFLITALLLTERKRTGGIDLRSFWTRRFRRLMPAALAALALATLFGITAADAVQRRNLAGDVTASLLDLANWRFIVSGQAYADLFGAPSPVLHFWSLAIEEQFYLLYPVLAWVALRVLKVRRAAFAALLAVLVAASLAVTLFAGFEPDRIYFGTDTRAAELLVGGLLATVLFHPRTTAALTTGRRTRPAVATAGAVALGACVVLWVTVPQGTAWLYRGGFTAYAVLSALVVLAAITPVGPVQRLLGSSPLRGLGLISYGVYLYHWPVFLWLTPARTGWSDAALLVPRLAVTFALALLSYRFLETPVRRGRRLAGVRPIRFVPLAAGTLVIATIVVTVSAPRPTIDFESAAAELELLPSLPEATGDDEAALFDGGGTGDDGTAAAPPLPPPQTVVGTPPRPRIAFFGDSTAIMTAIGVYRWSQAADEVDMVQGGAWFGCSIGRGGEWRSGSEYGFIPDKCNQWGTTWADRIAANQPNIAVVQIGPWDVPDRRLPGDSEWRALGDPVYDDFLLQEMTAAVDVLSAQGAVVVWLRVPPVGAGQLGDGQAVRGVAADPARNTRLNELIDQLPSVRPGKVATVDLAGWLADTGEDVRLRPDGVHFGADQATEVAERWLGPTLIATFQREWRRAEAERLAQASADRRRVLVLGDPSAADVADALATWGAESGLVEVVTIGRPPCGVLRTTTRRTPDGPEPTPAECEHLQYGWMQSAVAAQADVIVVAPSIWDVTDVSFAGASAVGPGDPAYDDEARVQLGELDDALTRAAPSVVWLAGAPMTWHPGAAPTPWFGAERTARYAALLDDLAGPGTTVVDLGALLAQAPPVALDPEVAVDGFAVADAAHADLGARLGPVVLGGP